jgi:hypothetical protein
MRLDPCAQVSSGTADAFPRVPQQDSSCNTARVNQLVAVELGDLPPKP